MFLWCRGSAVHRVLNHWLAKVVTSCRCTEERLCSSLQSGIKVCLQVVKLEKANAHLEEELKSLRQHRTQQQQQRVAKDEEHDRFQVEAIMADMTCRMQYFRAALSTQQVCT